MHIYIDTILEQQDSRGEISFGTFVDQYVLLLTYKFQ